ncbi:SIR2 family protein [Burkholderia stabilis]
MATRQVKDVPSKFPGEVRAFIRAFTDELVDNNVAIFAGAGLSASLGYVNWKELLRSVAEELGLDIDRETNLVALAQYHLNERRNRSELNRRIVSEFSDIRKPTTNHEILARLPISTYWTTNYDRMIETALEQANKVADVKYEVRQLKKTTPNRDAVVYKMHGDVEHPDDAVLTKDDYEGYFRKHEPFVTALSGDLTAKTFLFLGFSFSDPNIDYVMSRVRVTLHQAPKQHYCIMRREQKKAREKGADFEYRKHQQTFLIKDLARIGVHTLLVDEYGDITRILAAIEQEYRQRTIFISGSADDFSPWKIDMANQFVAGLSQALVEKKYRIVTGFGLGVGPSVIAGALDPILRDKRRYRQTQLVARPFPIAISDPRARRKAYQHYREEMIGLAGIAIFLFGNKRQGDDIIDADGVAAEFDMAVDQGLKVIPVGATGYVAARLWNRVMDELPAFYPNATAGFRGALEALAPTSRLSDPRSFIQAVVKVVEAIRSNA